MIRLDDECVTTRGVDCSYHYDYKRYQLMIDGFSGDDCFAITFASSDLENGRELDMEHYGFDYSSIEFVKTNEDLFTWAHGGPHTFGVRHNGKLSYPLNWHRNSFYDLYVHVLEVDRENNLAVVYFAAQFDLAPRNVDGLVAFALDGESRYSTPARNISMREGESLPVSFDELEYNPDFETYQWEVLRGNDLVILENTGSRTCTVKALHSGTVRIRCNYTYGIRYIDTLGNERRGSAGKTLDLEITIR